MAETCEANDITNAFNISKRDSVATTGGDDTRAANAIPPACDEAVDVLVVCRSGKGIVRNIIIPLSCPEVTQALEVTNAVDSSVMMHEILHVQYDYIKMYLHIASCVISK